MVSPWHLALYTVRTGSRRIRRIGGENEISFAWYRVSHLLLLSVMHLAHRIVSCTRHRLSSRHGIVGGVRRGSTLRLTIISIKLTKSGESNKYARQNARRLVSRLVVGRSLSQFIAPRPRQCLFLSFDTETCQRSDFS